jgi:hypothetical protein
MVVATLWHCPEERDRVRIAVGCASLYEIVCTWRRGWVEVGQGFCNRMSVQEQISPRPPVVLTPC